MVTAPALIGDLIRQLAPDPVGLDIVAELTHRKGLEARLQSLRPGLIIIGLKSGDSETLIASLLRDHPASKFIVLAHDGRSMTGIELKPHHTDLTELSPGALHDFILAKSF
jgi:DNA-binding NarL/FixJ family response regulator